MKRGGWHILREDGALTVSRRMPVRFDVSVDSRFPPLRKGRLAVQIRQDMWRALRKLRGFAPAVRVMDAADGVVVTAGGGLLCGGSAAPVAARVSALLDDPALRARWIRCAK